MDNLAHSAIKHVTLHKQAPSPSCFQGPQKLGLIEHGKRTVGSDRVPVAHGDARLDHSAVTHFGPRVAGNVPHGIDVRVIRLVQVTVRRNPPVSVFDGAPFEPRCSDIRGNPQTTAISNAPVRKNHFAVRHFFIGGPRNHPDAAAGKDLAKPLLGLWPGVFGNGRSRSQHDNVCIFAQAAASQPVLPQQC